MNKRLERGESTRGHILAVATALFTDQGFEGVSIEAILGAAGISKGALYHHFKSKEAVFTAVLEAVEERIVACLEEAGSAEGDPISALRAGCAAWLALAADDPVVRRIVLSDAPAVIGWQAWRTLDERYTLGLIRAALAAAAAAGQIDPERVEITAHVLLAALVEVALLIARAPGDPGRQREGLATVDALLNGLLRRSERGG